MKRWQYMAFATARLTDAHVKFLLLVYYVLLWEIVVYW